MALMDVAQFGSAPHDTTTPVSLTDIALRQNLPLFYLEQLFGRLKKEGIVTSVRGKNGGYILAKSMETLTIADIMRAVGEVVQTTRCKKSSTMRCTGTSVKCRTHDLWDKLETHIDGYLSSITLKNVCEGSLQP